MATTMNYHSPTFLNDNHISSPWRLIRKGLNIEGLCENFHCSAYNQMVVINLGFGEFDFARIILERKNKCPICREKIRPTKYALNKCRWWYVNHYSTDAFPLNTVHNTYELNDLHCEYQIIEIMPLVTNSIRISKSQEIICPICLSDIKNDNEIINLHCSHTFHRICIDGWLQSNEYMANRCPMCRVHIAESY